MGITSKRFCRVCSNITNWELDRVINHSFCIECGCRFGMSKRSKIIEFLNEEYLLKVEKLIKEYQEKVLKVVQTDLKNEIKES